MGKYIPRIVQELFDKGYAGKTVLVYDTKYEGNEVVDYKFYKAYEGITNEADHDYFMLGKDCKTVFELEKYATFVRVPEDLESVEYF